MGDLAVFWAVVPAGGAGTRLWPLSRAGHPKFLLDLTGSGRSLLQETLERLAPLSAERALVVTGEAHADAVRDQLPGLAGDRVLAEPEPRDSMAAIGLAAAVVEREDPEAVIGSFAADHVIPDAEAFQAAVREAVEVARAGRLVTLGVEPTHPATGFGYIRAGEPLEPFPTALRAVEFVEKPDAERARAYLGSGRYRWNAGMFVVRASVLLDLLQRWHPELADGLRAIAADRSRLAEIWPGLPRIAIDHAVAEPAAAAGHVAVVPAAFRWEDVGDFRSLGRLLPDDGGVRVLGAAPDVVALDATGVVVPSGGRQVALLGVEDLVVVDTPDAVLVTTRERAQEVKAVVDALRAAGREDLL
ncbi:mannose-1-phosphate guanylyltransferase [Phycicoccus endophyticus]|uniref:Mannose-1-phosphate guanylyltransferase n=1 Tax=Phycicoccus endophyticus TaxID=1690220 RepID=A0A7G9R2V7_9MICO|nr:sugar phosphate nucleotidyltransferase [Phycicoccus endophyticus]NHI20404.1 NTP transferase domain-containing protein [Phycicoccus endophyticus]QNN49932.1 mannose-1-phosphate guanylyltransferase [Phycicoccus endophyticus]GGL29496.1 mannose-1-phosphate guanyltransferase [Phycicoccus endophyticus]